MKDLAFRHDDNGVITKYDSQAKDYLRDDIPITFVAAEDALYLGLYKPFNQIYVEFETASVSEITPIVEISNGAGFNTIAFDDETKGFTRSGFITWERDQSAWASQLINSDTLYWLRIRTAQDFTATFKGVNIVYADDNDLKAEIRNIDEMLASGDSSFISYHVAARDEIVQTLRNGGNVKRVDDGTLSGNLLDVTKWDLLEAGEVRQAAKYLALAKIMFDVSVNIDDKYYQRYRDYEGMYGAAFKLFRMSLDTDDDGKVDDVENLALNDVTVMKL